MHNRKHTVFICTGRIIAWLSYGGVEYAAVVWDPYHNNKVDQLEEVQQRTARWVLNDYNCYSSVTAMMQRLSWQSLQVHRKIARLHL